MSEADSEAILKVLVDHGVDFVVIGASAAILQGVPIAATFDLDVSVARSKVNLTRLEGALRELEARLRLPEPHEQVEMSLDARTLRGLSAVTLTTRYGPFDVLFAPSGAPPYEDLKERAAEVAPFHLGFRVASIDDLIAMKRAAGREKDAVHLTALIGFLKDRTEAEKRARS